jgi:hypothetical protein
VIPEHTTAAPPADLRDALRRAAAGTDDVLVADWLRRLAEDGESTTLDGGHRPGDDEHTDAMADSDSS